MSVLRFTALIEALIKKHLFDGNFEYAFFERAILKCVFLNPFFEGDILKCVFEKAVLKCIFLREQFGIITLGNWLK